MHKLFEYLISLETATFGLDMAPPNFFDNERFIVTLGKVVELTECIFEVVCDV